MAADAGADACAVSLAGCADSYVPKAEPSFYRDLSIPGNELDAAAAASMISGYRANNDLPQVTLDPALMQFAQAQAALMARRDKLDHDAGKPFIARLKLPATMLEPRRKISVPATNAGRSLFRLARFAAAPRQHAAQGRLAHGHRRGDRAGVEIQGLLDADTGRAGRAERLGCLTARR